jgi:3-oxoacyl-[acyl-carrier protein] reductase
LRNGYFVYVHGFSNKVLNKEGAEYIYGDLSKIEDCEKIADYIDNIDVLVNNAGKKPLRKGFIEYDANEIQQMVNVNLLGTMQLTRLLIPKINNDGSIVNITSEAGTFGGNGIIPYAVAKAGMNIFTKALARELGEQLITVNAVSPGIIQTGEHSEDLAHTVPLKRLGMPEDVAEAVMFLVKMRYINGSIVPVTGGR